MKRRVLIVGCGDVGNRLLPLISGRLRVFVLYRRAEQRDHLRQIGVTPIRGDLDVPDSLFRLADIADDVIHLAPPPSAGVTDTRTAHLLRALERGRRLPRRFVYISTTGVYGDCRGAWVSETRPVRPESDRAVRRVDAERQVRRWATDRGVRVTVLRVPGIYAGNRLPLERLRAGTPVMASPSDPYTNHIHADDLARAVVAALMRGASGRIYNATDCSDMTMGQYFDLVAERFGLPPPPRVSVEDAGSKLPPMLLSFMRESRRIRNDRLLSELRVRLRYPTVLDGVPRLTRSP